MKTGGPACERIAGIGAGGAGSPAGSGRRLLGHGTGGDAGVSFVFGCGWSAPPGGKKTEETAHGNEEVVAEAVRKGKEIQDYIDDWEPDDEDDELDEEALWAPVLTITASFQKDGRFRVPAVRDKKK